MGDVRRRSGKPRSTTRKKATPRKRKPVRRARPKVTFTEGELLALNRATAMLSLAQQALESVWAPIRQKHGIQREVVYDRKTGVVTDG